MRPSRELVKIINEFKDKGTKPYDTPATVKRIQDGIAWVHIEGGAPETPAELTINAKEGDKVQVRISGGSAFLIGNGTSPPTDDTRANQAYRYSQVAYQAAESAVSDAKVAYQAAESAVADAQRAHAAADEAKAEANTAKGYAEDAKTEAGKAKTEADKAKTAADEAKTEAENAKAEAENAGNAAAIAQTSANEALVGLSIVENVVDAVNWMAEHGHYAATNDTSVIDNKVYYTLTGTKVNNPTGNPSRNGYYELISGKYALSTDKAVNTSKDYYVITATSVTEPDTSQINTYYDLILDEAINQYINQYLALTRDGLRLTDGGSKAVYVSTDKGITFYDGSKQIANYGETVTIGDKSGYHMEITDSSLRFMNGAGEIAYMTNNELYIPRVVVVDSMKISNWLWDASSLSNHLTLKYIGG